MSGGLKLPVSHCETESIVGIQFGVFKAEQLKKFGVCHVTSSVSYTLTGEPKPNGLADRRMGSTELRVPCETCSMESPECPGHFGYTELSEPVFNIGLFDVTYSALSAVCQNCGSLLMDDSLRAAVLELETGVDKLRFCKARKQMVCKSAIAGKACGHEQAVIRKPPPKARNGLFLIASRNQQETVLFASHVYQMLNRISDDDARLMGFKPDFCHPRDLIMTVLPIPPPAVRPSVSFGGAARSENELTVQLSSVLKVNEKLRGAKDANAPVNTLIPDIKRLQELISVFINNASTYYQPAKLRGRLPLQSLTERLKGKQGRLRGYLMGKRVDFSARTVITGDPVIDVDQVGVPYSVAMTLTVPEKVNHINRKWLTGLVQSTVYPGANYIIHKNGAMRNLSKMQARARKKLTVEIGDIVERHLQDGDPVLFNRQPSLHRMSMMGHRARVLPFNTFRLNLTCTTPYNADFDGDEMNLHVPQSLLTKAELIEIMMVTKNFVTPNKSQPCMGIVQDSLLGCFRITDRETFMDKYFMQNLLLWLTKDRQMLPVPAIVKPQALWTGKQVFSLLLPEVNSGGQDPHKFKHDDSELVVRRGQLISGMISKSIVGVSAGSMIHVIYNEKGADEVVRFVNAVQRTVQFFLYQNSFSVGIQDTIIAKETLDEQKELMDDAEKRAKHAAAAVSEGKLPKKPGMTLLESFETDSNKILNDARKNAATKALLAVRRTNAFRVMILAGSKGSELNIFQIAVSVGQQNVAGKRIPFHFRRRTLPCYCKDDYLPTSRGLVKNGFVAGLTPFEFVFHTMGGREGLIDTACKTAETGYLQRKLIKSMEDISVFADSTCRYNTTKEVVQFTYGEDGLDGHRIEPNQKVDVIKFDDATMRQQYHYEYDARDGIGHFHNDFGGGYMTPELKRFLRSNSATMGKLDEEFNELMRARDLLREYVPELADKVTLYLPVNVERLIHNAKSFYDVGRSSQQTSLNPHTVIDNVRQLATDLMQLFPTHGRVPLNLSMGAVKFESPFQEARIQRAVELFTLHLKTMLASKKVLKDYRLNETAFNYLISEIRLKYMQSIVHSGEMIGAIAAQSCGEPATQMTLNTFHNAGISSKNVTLGVPRLLELLNVSKNQRVSNMVIRLAAEHSTKAKAGVALHQIESTTLLSLVTGWSIVYDPDPLQSIVPEDERNFRLMWAVQEREARHDEMSPWVARIELDAQTVVLKSTGVAIGVMEAARKMMENDAKFMEHFHVEMTTDGQAMQHKVATIRIRLNKKAVPNFPDTIAFLRERVPEIMRTLHVRGVAGVTKVFTQEKKITVVDEVTHGLKMEKIWFLETEGSALRAVMSDVVDERGRSFVEAKYTSSNNIPEICDVLGIEAARKKLLLEMREVYAGYDIRINYRQYSLLVDTMCHRGYIMAVSRTGINKINSVGPLMRCSFEETVTVLMSAAAFGEFDPVRGVSACIALGKQARVGTGTFDLLLDINALRAAVPQKELVEVGRVANVYAGQSTVAYRRAADADETAANAEMRRDGKGQLGTPLFDASTLHGAAGGASAAVDFRGGGGQGRRAGLSAGAAGTRSYSGGYNTGGGSSGAAFGLDMAMMSQSGGGQQQQQQRGVGVASAVPSVGPNQVYGSSNNNNNNSAGRSAGAAAGGGMAAYYPGSGAAAGGGVFIPPAPSATYGISGGSTVSSQIGQRGSQAGSGVHNAMGVSPVGSAYHPTSLTEQLPAEWTTGDTGRFRFQSTEYTSQSQSQGQGGSGGGSHGGGRSASMDSRSSHTSTGYSQSNSSISGARRSGVSSSYQGSVDRSSVAGRSGGMSAAGISGAGGPSYLQRGRPAGASGTPRQAAGVAGALQNFMQEGGSGSGGAGDYIADRQTPAARPPTAQNLLVSNNQQQQQQQQPSTRGRTGSNLNNDDDFSPAGSNRSGTNYSRKN